MVVIERDIEKINSVEIEEVTSTEGKATISYLESAKTMSIESKIKNAKPTMFGMDNVPKWKIALWVYIGRIKGRILVAVRNMQQWKNSGKS